VKLLIYSFNCVLGGYGPFYVMKMGCESCDYYAIPSSGRIGRLNKFRWSSIVMSRKAGRGPEKFWLFWSRLSNQ